LTQGRGFSYNGIPLLFSLKACLGLVRTFSATPRPFKSSIGITKDIIWYGGLEDYNGTHFWNNTTKSYDFLFTNRDNWVNNFDWMERRVYIPEEFAIVRVSKQEQRLLRLKLLDPAVIVHKPYPDRPCIEYDKYNELRTWLVSTFGSMPGMTNVTTLQTYTKYYDLYKHIIKE
jgi:hypothetical protein